LENWLHCYYGNNNSPDWLGNNDNKNQVSKLKIKIVFLPLPYGRVFKTLPCDGRAKHEKSYGWIMKLNKRNVILVISITALGAFWAGCNSAAGLLGNLGSERDSEKITPAEYKFPEKETSKILVLVNQPGWIKTPVDLRSETTKYINEGLKDKEKAKIPEDRLIKYQDVLNARIELPEEKRNEPNQIAAKLGAKYIINVQILDFDLSTFAEKDFFNGQMKSEFTLLDANGVKLWPEKENRSAIVEIEAEKGTVELAVAKLTAATAHCVTRYFYDCKTIRFRVPEENKEIENYDF
jgi:hypothetical protein